MPYKIGFIGMVKKELEEDLWGTLEKMAALGYQGIESPPLVAGSSDEMKESRRRLDGLGMEAVAVFCSHYKRDELDRQIRAAQILGAKYIMNYWSGPETRDEALALAATLEEMALACKREGLRYLYHNHDHEFVPQFGDRKNECLFEIYYNNTEALGFELDIAWAHFGGADPIRLIRRCGHRIPVLHVKDLFDDRIRGQFCAVGLGEVDCFGAIEAAAAKGAEWMVVEQDQPGRLGHYESAMASILNIREAGLHPVRR